jgi:hypothetical protein
MPRHRELLCGILAHHSGATNIVGRALTGMKAMVKRYWQRGAAAAAGARRHGHVALADAAASPPDDYVHPMLTRLLCPENT